MKSARSALAIAGCAGVLTPFLPAAARTSPFRALGLGEFGWDLPLIAAPFFLAILVSLISLRTAIFPSFSRWVAAIGLLLSIALSAATLAWFVGDAAPRLFVLKPQEWIVAIAWVAPIAAGTAVVVWLQQRGAAFESLALAAMQCTYSANALGCILGYWKFLEPAAVLTAITVLLYAAQLTVLVLEN